MNTSSIFYRMVVLAMLCILPAQAKIHVKLTQGSATDHPIAVTDFQGATPEHAQFGREMARAMRTNFTNAGVFNVISQKAFIQNADDALKEPKFRDWRVIGARSLVVGKLSPTMDGRVQFSYILYNVLTQKEVVSHTLTTDKRSWRRLVHMASDDIYKRLMGEDGFFDSQVAYIAERKQGTQAIKQLAIMDQDGENHRYLTMGKNIVLTPRFSPTRNEIVYLDYGITNTVPKVYILNLKTGMRTLVGRFPGMTYAPRYSPDGKKVLMSATDKGAYSHIYEMDLGTKSIRKLTEGKYIDTSPSYSPDGKKIVFNSDRPGTQQLYVMDSNGKNIKRISFGPGGRYAAPVWSPRGDMICFTKIFDGAFHIGVMRTDGKGERLLSTGYIVEDPFWSPNGKAIIFTRQDRAKEKGKNGDRRIRIIDLAGFYERNLPTPSGVNAVTATWSPSRDKIL
ncbi:MAG: Tol-Pal system protein TolB [Alphaproteobacteria bacterium]|nr:MAG: Tol-Pal system protein TolB [Alphaproteobacteria bacterium]